MQNNPTPRARYNSNFVSRLSKVLETNPEADLRQEILKYNSQRLKNLRGQGNTKTVERIPQLVQEKARPPIPEPDGDFSITWPLSAQLQTMIGADSSDASKNLPLVFRRLLKEGTVLYQVSSRWVVRISPTIVVKFAPGLDISEIHTMSYIWPNKGIPIPEPLGAFSIGAFNYIFMSYIEGVTLTTLWPTLTLHLKTSVQFQLGEILNCLRKVPLASKYLGSGNPPRCKDIRRHIRTSPTSISNETNFNTFLISTPRKLNPVYLDLCTSQLATDHNIVMTHSDIRPDNILVSHITPDTIKIVGLIDWEVSGAYPEYWEYVKARHMVDCDLSDWFSYLPTDVIGSHYEAWRQDMFISRLVL